MPDWILEQLTTMALPLSTLLLLLVAGWFVSKAFTNKPNLRIYRQLMYVGLGLLGLILIVAVSPLSDKSTIMNFLGLGLTAIIGLSSTTFVSNAMAGLMLKAMSSFHTGDFIRVGGYFGGVRAKALLHIEIQNQDRDIVHLPNLFLITNPVQVVDQTGTLISAEVSIGYDNHRLRVQQLLLDAAQQAKLRDAFVHIIELGNYAVAYRVTGILQEDGKLISKQHDLKAAILDALHEGEIEIMTPSVMNQRPVSEHTRTIPDQYNLPPPDPDSGKAERIMFDKSELAARIDRLRERAADLRSEIEDLQHQHKDQHAPEIAWREDQIENLENIIQNFDNEQ